MVNYNTRLLLPCSNISLLLQSAEDGTGNLRSRTGRHGDSHNRSRDVSPDSSQVKKNESWRRIVLLIVAITVHNIPGDVCVCARVPMHGCKKL